MADHSQHRVRVSQLRRPIQVSLSHQPPDAPVPARIRHEEASITHVRAPTRVVGLDVKAPEAVLRPILALNNVLRLLNTSQEHNGPKVLEPVRRKFVMRHGLDHGVRVALLDLLGELVREIDQQRGRYLVFGCKRYNGGYRLAVT